MLEINDQMNRVIRLERPPERIISLVPSQTELLYDLGCENQVVGITKFCIHPNSWFRQKTRIGGTKKVNFDKIAALNPDLIIANKEENTKEEIEKLCQLYPVYISDITSFEEALEMIRSVGQLVGKTSKAEQMASQIDQDLHQIPTLKGRVLYFIWANPYMVAGKNTFIGHVLDQLGVENAITDQNARYIELNEQDLKQVDADYFLLSSEPFPFQRKHQDELMEKYAVKSVLVDGEMFSWYGSRMLKMKEYFQGLAHEFPEK